MVVVSSQMRTFPKALAGFREIVNERGQKLRQLKFEELGKLIKPLPEGPLERLTVDSRPATIGIIVERKNGQHLKGCRAGIHECQACSAREACRVGWLLQTR